MIECVNKSNNFCENSNTFFVGNVEDNLKLVNYKFECNQGKSAITCGIKDERDVWLNLCHIHDNLWMKIVHNK